MSFGAMRARTGESVAQSRDGTRLSAFFREMAVHDWMVFAFLAILNVAVVRAPDRPIKPRCLIEVGSLLLVFLVVAVLVRGRFVRESFWTGLIYRVGIYGPVQLSYFFLKDVLPLVNEHSLDWELYQLDLDLFGIEPAMALDRFVNPVTTEWFAFFYFWYFFLLALHVVPILFMSRRKDVLGEFAFGMLMIFCIGHTGYMLVPGYGPYRAMADQFQNAFPSGMWLDMVMRTVQSGGAQKDIFPSLHTGAPAFIALFSFRNRDKIPFRYTWPAVALFAVNIIGATMFLRWHYIIDVVAGLALATAAALIAPRVMRWELNRRSREALGPLWPALYRD